MAKTIGLIPAEKHSCPVCGKEYKNQDALKRHISDKHPEDKKQSETDEQPE